MIDFIILAVVAVILGLAGGYVYRSMKAGKTCIGCPDNGNCPSQGCSGSCGGCGGCGGNCPSRKR